MTFKKIVFVDPCGLIGPFKEKIENLSSQEPVIYDTYPKNNTEIIERINNADCVLVSWNTKIDSEVIRSCPSIRYIGMCCSLYDEQSANVDIVEARKHNIVVKGVRDYGDNGTVEFIFAELISLFKGLGKHQWKKEATELTGKTIGIIGMGVLGNMVASTALHFGMKVIYYSRSRKGNIEAKGVEYVSLNTLLTQSDIITTHLPRNISILGAKEMRLLKDDAIYINTSLGQPFEKEPFLNWIGKNSGNYAIFDSAGYSDLCEIFKSYTNIILIDKSSGFTIEARYRLTEKVFENMQAYPDK